MKYIKILVEINEIALDKIAIKIMRENPRKRWTEKEKKNHFKIWLNQILIAEVNRNS